MTEPNGAFGISEIIEWRLGKNTGSWVQRGNSKHMTEQIDLLQAADRAINERIKQTSQICL